MNFAQSLFCEVGIKIGPFSNKFAGFHGRMLVVTHQRKIADHHMDTSFTDRSVKDSVGAGDKEGLA